MASVRKLCDFRHRRHRLGLALLLMTLGGCARSGDAAKPAPPAEPNVLPKNYRQQVVDFMRVYLVDPVKVRDAYISEPALKAVAGSTHFVSCVRYNPRDGDGRYEGNTERMALFLGGRLNQFLPATPDACQGVAYQRFPEAEVMVP
jgi:hypothetical protein